MPLRISYLSDRGVAVETDEVAEALGDRVEGGERAPGPGTSRFAVVVEYGFFVPLPAR